MSNRIKRGRPHYTPFPSSNHPETSIGHVSLKGAVSIVATPIANTPDYMERLKSLVHCEEDLLTAGYIMKELSSETLEMKKRCSGCGKRMLLSNTPLTISCSYLSPAMSRFVPRNKKKQTRTQHNLGHARNDSLPSLDIRSDDDAPHNTESPSKIEPRMRCKFHSGQLKTRVCVEYHVHKLLQSVLNNAGLVVLWQQVNGSSLHGTRAPYSKAL